ncbi:hypothetical protein EYF80_068268 [Liparis tanakae]|uniref:Uncharacterized protein n=1 Tax=Liparis tanakae TaxID=230148 RepID=A0A4Z2DYV6_9TELE|nr:hypothetical protein EYF80_068268 [Liparis tanakae]
MLANSTLNCRDRKSVNHVSPGTLIHAGMPDNTNLHRHEVDVYELEGSPHLPVHLQIRPVTPSSSDAVYRNHITR